MAGDRVVALALGDPDLKVTELTRLSLQDGIALDAWLFRVCILNLQAAQSLECVVPDECRS